MKLPNDDQIKRCLLKMCGINGIAAGIKVFLTSWSVSQSPSWDYKHMHAYTNTGTQTSHQICTHTKDLSSTIA